MPPDYLAWAERRFRLDWWGDHGIRHWVRVRANGLLLAARTGADPEVVSCFALVHDLERENECHDPDHGLRAAEMAERISDRFFGLDSRQIAMVCAACEGHSGGHIVSHATIATCWDADRLDLARVGITPSPERLCTAAARDPDFLARAIQRSHAQ